MSKVISVTIEMNGEIITIGDSVTAGSPMDKVEYADDGWSVEMRNGCVRSKVIDDYLDNLIEDGDEYQKAYAKVCSRWFGNFIECREYDEDTKLLLRRNYGQQNSVFTFTVIMLNFYPNYARDMSDKKAPFTYIRGEKAEGCKVYVAGFNPYRAYKTLEKNVILMIRRRIKQMRNEVEDPNHPSFKDWHRDD